MSGTYLTHYNPQYCLFAAAVICSFHWSLAQDPGQYRIFEPPQLLARCITVSMSKPSPSMGIQILDTYDIISIVVSCMVACAATWMIVISLRLVSKKRVMRASLQLTMAAFRAASRILVYNPAHYVSTQAS